MPDWLPNWTDALGWVKGLVLLAGGIFFVTWHHTTLRREEERDERFDAPSSHQLRWHIRHARQDLALIAYLLMAILGVLIWIAAKL